MQLIPKNVIAYDQNLVLHVRKLVSLSLYRLLVSRDMSDFLEEIRRGEGWSLEVYVKYVNFELGGEANSSL